MQHIPTKYQVHITIREVGQKFQCCACLSCRQLWHPGFSLEFFTHYTYGSGQSEEQEVVKFNGIMYIKGDHG